MHWWNAGIEHRTQGSRGLDGYHAGYRSDHCAGDVEAPDGVNAARTKWERWPVADPRGEAGDTLVPYHRVVNEIDRRIDALFLDYWRNLA
jgi:hypothetical protein